MKEELLEYAYAALLHDIGKFYQRTELSSTLSTQEKECTPINQTFGYHTHIHSGYTSKFFKNYLKLFDKVERASSCHHIDMNETMDDIIKQADILASKVDRNDEKYDNEQEFKNSRYRYITSRLNSIMSEVDFGKPRKYATFPLTKIDDISLPLLDFSPKSAKESAEEYKVLFQEFVHEVNKENLLIGNVTPFKFNRMYSLLYRYTSLIPASTYETNCPTVSLFDHLKLTTAIASCLYYQNEKKFYMVEFDVSGIQNFIYHVTEGSNTKPKLSKSLRGRSAFVSLLTNSITYALLNEFSLTQANIISNTGGGAIILLPYLDNTKERVNQLFSTITDTLYERFNTQLTFVFAIEELDEVELEAFKTEKALSLKAKLDQAKNQKYKDIIDDNFIVEKIVKNDLCPMCGDNPRDGHEYCQTCNQMIDISDKYTDDDQFSIWYDFDSYDEDGIDLGYVNICFIDKDNRRFIKEDDYFYVDAINHFGYGNVKMIANLVPKKDGTIMTFEEMVKTLDKSYGDQKLGVLKMDVDNLGAVFAFGLKQNLDIKSELQRSLSKYQTLSRFIELFFSLKLKQICQQVSQLLQHTYDNIFYINYAGGDDLVILGSIYGIMQLANEIHKQFEAYVSNPNITLSAGIHIQSPKKPIRFGILQADEALDLSKEYTKDGQLQKNAITIMGTTVSFNEFETILSKVEKYKAYLSEGHVSRTSFYNLMSVIQVDDMDKYYPLIPKIQYTLFRNIKNEDIRGELNSLFTTVKDLNELNYVILMMKLVILFTRED